MPDAPSKPTLIYDGDCGFCRRWIARWKQTTGERVEYAPFQEVADQYPQIAREQFDAAVQLALPDGSIHHGAEAVFRTLATVPSKRWLYFLYQYLPLFGPIARWFYRFVARHRGGFGTLTTFLWGSSVEVASFELSRRLFIRFLGLIYLIAFASMAVQVEGLIGKNGITPIAEFLPRVEQHLGAAAYWKLPTLCWWKASDEFLKFLCVGGAVMGGLLVLGVLPIPLLIGCWIFYLSIVNAGQVFTSFQWDIFLLETGFLAIFFGPLSWRLGSPRAAPVSRVVRWLIQWLLFRLMFLSGVVKLIAGAGEPEFVFGLTKRLGCWWDLTALTYHYETQPIPTWTAWYAHQLPLWFQKSSVVLMFVAELAAPLLLSGPRRIRHAGVAMIVGLMAVIGATGNYNFFNLLTVALCVPCLDDGLLKRFIPTACRRWIASPKPRDRRRVGRGIVIGLLAAFIIPASLAESYSGVWRRAVVWPRKWVQNAVQFTDPFRLVNSYGLFRDMTLTRPEIIIEGSNDGRNWVEYEFKWKPGDLNRAPGFCEPHQPRLDWQMWFAALSNYQRTPWMAGLLQRILEGSSEVLALLDKNPFAGSTPKFVRAVLYDYHFTDANTRSKTGAWWRREFLRVYAPPMSRSRR